MKPYEDLAELPFADALKPFDEEWTVDGVYDTVHISGDTLVDIDVRGSRFIECAVTQTTLERGRLRGARLDEVWLRETRLISTDLSETEWLDSAFVSSVLAGVQSYGSGMRRVIFHGCKLDSVNFRGARLFEVRFTDCLLRDVDFAGATLNKTSFRGCTLRGVTLSRTTLEQADFRGAELGISAGHESLRGAIIDSTQLYDLAPALAQSLGITVRDR